MPPCPQEVSAVDLIVGALLEIMDEDPAAEAVPARVSLDETLAARCASL
jgi:hypothetical protein